MKTAGTQRCHEMVQLGGGKRPAKKPPGEEQWWKSWGDGCNMGWSAGHSTGHSSQFMTGLSGDVLIAALCSSRDEEVESIRVNYLCWDDFSSQSSLQTSLMKHDTLPFPVWTQSGWGSLCARYPRLEQGWRGSQGCDLSDICIPPHDCSSAPIRLWFQTHQNKTLSISAVIGYTNQKSTGKLDTRIRF